MLSGTIHTHIFFHFIFRWPLRTSFILDTLSDIMKLESF